MADEAEVRFQEMFDSFILSYTDSDTSLAPLPMATTLHEPSFLQPPSPPPSEPGDIYEAPNHAQIIEIANYLDRDFYTALAYKLDFTSLPENWRRILYHAYLDYYSATALHFPRIHRNALISRAIALAKQRCEESNPLWAAEENQMIIIGDAMVRTSMSQELFRTKMQSVVGKADRAFHSHTLQTTIHLLTSQPGYPALMPHLPGPAGTMFSRDQKGFTEWYLTWGPTYGYVVWHGFSNDQIQWFDNIKLRNMLYCALRDTQSLGYFSLQEAHQTDGGIWTWRPLQARGGAAISVVSYTLASVSVSMRADFLQEYKWDQCEGCPARRGAIQEEQGKIHDLLNKIATLSVSGLDAEESQDAHDGLLGLLNYLGFTL